MVNILTPKRHILAWNHVFWAIARENPLMAVGEFPKKSIYILYVYTFFRNSPTGQRIFARDVSKDVVSRKDVPFGG